MKYDLTNLQEIDGVEFWNELDTSNCSERDPLLSTLHVAMLNAAKGHSSKTEVKRMKEHFEEYATDVLSDIRDGSYRDKLKYRSLTKVNPNGKVRHILSPSLYTRVLQHLAIVLIQRDYDRHDNLNGLNCKEGCGITASDHKKSVVHRLKHVYYDRRDLNYGLVLDQRKCYEHITKKIARKALKRIVRDKWVIDFTVDVTFCGNDFPIGTPTSPPIHHIIMLTSDYLCKQISSCSVRYADDNILFFHTKEEANAAKWRLINFWWYELGMRAKRHTVSIFPLTKPVDFCGFVFHRIEGKGICDHNKGYTTVRKSIVDRAKKCNNNKSWASYFGIFQHGDMFGLMTQIESKMKLRELTKTIRINRKMDAPNIAPKDLVGKVFNIYDYELRSDSHGQANWIKLLIGIPELDSEGIPTGKESAFELHGGYMFLVEFIVMCEKEYGKKNLLPLEEMEIEQSCGYIFKGSTNQMQYIEEYGG